MHFITRESGQKKPLFYTSYFFIKNIALSAGIGALAGKIFRSFTPSHGALMGAFSGGVRFTVNRILMNQCVLMNQAAERAREPVEGGEKTMALLKASKELENESKNLMSILTIGLAALTMAPLAANFFGKPTDRSLLFRFHFSHALGYYLAFPKAQHTFFSVIDTKGHGTWMENWAEKEWLTRAPCELPPIDAKINWNKFQRVPEVIQLQENVPKVGEDEWAGLCNKVNWKETSPFTTIGKALENINKTANSGDTRTSGSFRYLQNLMNQLYQKLSQEEDLDKLEELLRYLQKELKFCQSQWLQALYNTLQHYELKNGNFKGLELMNWALTIDQEIREDLLKNKIASDFEPQLRNIHYYEVTKYALAKEKIFTNPGGVDGHALFEQANPGAGDVMKFLNCGRNPCDDLREQVTKSSSHWIEAFKHRYHPASLHATFKDRLNALTDEKFDRIKDFLCEVLRKRLGKQNISIKNAMNFVNRRFIENRRCNDAGTTIFLKGLDFFEAEGELLPGKTDEKCLEEILFLSAHPHAENLLPLFFEDLQPNDLAIESIEKIEKTTKDQSLQEILTKKLLCLAAIEEDEEKGGNIHVFGPAFLKAVRSYLGEDCIAVEDLENLVTSNLIDTSTQNTLYHLNKDGVNFLLSVLGFKEFENQLLKDMSNEELLKTGAVHHPQREDMINIFKENNLEDVRKELLELHSHVLEAYEINQIALGEQETVFSTTLVKAVMGTLGKENISLKEVEALIKAELMNTQEQNRFSPYNLNDDGIAFLLKILAGPPWKGSLIQGKENSDLISKYANPGLFD